MSGRPTLSGHSTSSQFPVPTSYSSRLPSPDFRVQKPTRAAYAAHYALTPTPSLGATWIPSSRCSPFTCSTVESVQPKKLTWLLLVAARFSARWSQSSSYSTHPLLYSTIARRQHTHISRLTVSSSSCSGCTCSCPPPLPVELDLPCMRPLNRGPAPICTHIIMRQAPRPRMPASPAHTICGWPAARAMQCQSR